MCLGILIGAAATDASFYFLMWRTNWDQEADKAAERVGKPSANAEFDLQNLTSLELKGSDKSLRQDQSEDQCSHDEAGDEATRLLSGHSSQSMEECHEAEQQ